MRNELEGLEEGPKVKILLGSHRATFKNVAN